MDVSRADVIAADVTEEVVKCEGQNTETNDWQRVGEYRIIKAAQFFAIDISLLRVPFALQRKPTETMDIYYFFYVKEGKSSRTNTKNVNKPIK